MTHVASRQEWVEARRALLIKEKELTRQRDELSRLRRELPWEAVEKEYIFDGRDGQRTLADLFDGHSQLVVYHMMSMGPHGETPCSICSFWADSFNGVTSHMNDRDVALAVVSRLPLPALQAFAERMGWRFPIVSSANSEFNFDYHVTFSREQIEAGPVDYNYALKERQQPEAPGVSVFAKEPDGRIFHTYSAYSRGLDALNVAYQYLDLVPRGRNEGDLPFSFVWIRYHDEYPHLQPAG